MKKTDNHQGAINMLKKIKTSTIILLEEFEPILIQRYLQVF